MNPVGYQPFTYVNGNPVLWVDPFGLKFYDFKTSSRTTILNAIKNDDWLIFSGHGSETKEVDQEMFGSTTLGSLFYPKVTVPAAIGPDDGSWSISINDQDFLDAIKIRKESGNKLKMSAFFACDSVEIATAFRSISDISIGMANAESKIVMWGYAELFAETLESGKSVSNAIYAGESYLSDYAQGFYNSTFQRIEAAISNPIIQNVNYNPRNYYLENCNDSEKKE
jgi:hypothetical protein